MRLCIDMQGIQTASRHRGIGRYCLSVTRELLASAESDLEVTLLFNGALDGIDEAIPALATPPRSTRRRLFGPIRATSFDNPGNDARREAAERVFQYALDGAMDDVVWLSSVVEGFSDDALIPHAAPNTFTVATLYDLIPLHDPEYMGNGRARDWYLGRLNALKRCDLLLAISEWVREDAISRLNVSPSRIVNIGAGVDPSFNSHVADASGDEARRAAMGIRGRYVMYNGGFDKRKNVSLLLESYAALPVEMLEAHQLVIVGGIDANNFQLLADSMSKLGLTAGDVLFPGFVSDQDLIRLYQGASLFVFPSEREGFGLPALEAMACGAPTIVNCATSLPEVVGHADGLFDASIPGALAVRMREVLQDPFLASNLRENGLARAKHFTWAKVAARALAAIDSVRQTSKAQRESRAQRDGLLITNAEEAELAIAHPAFPVYRFDAENVIELQPWLERWPGVAHWHGAAPALGPIADTSRYRLDGYVGLIRQGPGSDWIRLIAEDALGPVTRDGHTDIAINQHGSLLRQRQTEDEIATACANRLSDDDLAQVADAIARVRQGPPRWLVDVTHIADRDLGTGIHRVVRSILGHWLRHPPIGVRIEPIAFRDGRFVHAHAYARKLLNIASSDDLVEDRVSISGNEVFIGLDWALESLPGSAPVLRTWKRAGVSIHFMVNDLLPITLPEAFHPQTHRAFKTWLETATSLCDHLHCISGSTASELAEWMTGHSHNSAATVSHFPLGVDPVVDHRQGEIPQALATAMASRPSVLMVGTLEPRKGHAQALDAFDLLWEAGADANLVIVGHRGWLVQELVDRLSNHREREGRLFWLDDASDASLASVYAAATVLLAPSLGEGFGLPLIEAAMRKLPVIARSLPVFREIGGSYPHFFDTKSAEGLATVLARWLADRPASGVIPKWPTWAGSANALRDAVVSAGGGPPETRRGSFD